MKRRKGKLVFSGSIASLIRTMRFNELPITAVHCEASATLPMLHHDPFDRLLIAQAQVEGMTLITRDAMIPKYGVLILRA